MKKPIIEKVVVVGAGAFGTALTKLAAQNSAAVYQLVREEMDVKDFTSTHRNKHLPSFKLPRNVYMTLDYPKALADADIIIWTVPASACIEASLQLRKWVNSKSIVIVGTKGLVGTSLTTVSQTLLKEWGEIKLAVLSGPNFANQIVRGDLSGAIAASSSSSARQIARKIFTTDRFIVRLSNDVLGVELFGALKNVLAIASGALAGLGWGWNSRALLITAGLQEIVQLACHLGAQRHTLESLAGIGDLMATCSHRGSRNFQVGHRLARGERLNDILLALSGPAEGVHTLHTLSVYLQDKSTTMPIVNGIYQIVHQGVSVRQAIREVITTFNGK